MTTYLPTSYYVLEPHSQHITDPQRQIDITALASTTYGREYYSLSGAARDLATPLPNGTPVLYLLTEDEDYDEALHDHGWPSVYLGYNPQLRKSVVLDGMTEMEYWKSLSVDPERGSDWPSRDRPHPGHVFKSQASLDSHLTPSLRGVLADLISKDILPRGDYLFNYWR